MSAAPRDRRAPPGADRRGARRDLRARAPRLPQRVLRHRLRPQGRAASPAARSPASTSRTSCTPRIRSAHARRAHRLQPRRRRSVQAAARACAATSRRRSSTTRTSTSAPTSATPTRPPRRWTASRRYPVEYVVIDVRADGVARRRPVRLGRRRAPLRRDRPLPGPRVRSATSYSLAPRSGERVGRGADEHVNEHEHEHEHVNVHVDDCLAHALLERDRHPHGGVNASRIATAVPPPCAVAPPGT